MSAPRQSCAFHWALATDYDGTLTRPGKSTVEPTTLAALRRLRRQGYRLVLITGRRLPELRRVFPAVREFDRVVAENGALLWEPATERIAILAPPPPPALWRTLRAKHVRPLARGAIILATTDPHEPVLRRALRRLAPRFRIVRNRESLMVLPAGVDKASGLRWALADLGISAACTIAIGDGENDVSLLRAAGSGVAVANAVPRLRQRATWVTHAPAGAGVVELIGRLLER